MCYTGKKLFVCSAVHVQVSRVSVPPETAIFLSSSIGIDESFDSFPDAISRACTPNHAAKAMGPSSSCLFLPTAATAELRPITGMIPLSWSKCLARPIDGLVNDVGKHRGQRTARRRAERKALRSAPKRIHLGMSRLFDWGVVEREGRSLLPTN